MVLEPNAIALPLPVIVHVPAESVQLPNEALLVVSVNVTVPVGTAVQLAVTSPCILPTTLEPVPLHFTVAANCVVPLEAMLFGVAVTVVVVLSMWTVSVPLAVLDAL
jgi:hypothetical protein